MGKKKNDDFKKVKVKIGKSKPANNVVKFDIKPIKIVHSIRKEIDADKSRDIDRAANRKLNFRELSRNNEKSMTDYLKYLQSILDKKIREKREIMTKNKFDITQSMWKTIYHTRWKTPWDDLIQRFHDEFHGSNAIWSVFLSSIGHTKPDLRELALKSIDKYFQLFGNHEDSFINTKCALSFALELIQSTNQHKKKMALEILSIMATHCPLSLWFVSRWNSAVTALSLLEYFSNSLNNGNSDNNSIGSERFAEISSAIIASVIDGNRAGIDFVGEDRAQYEDFMNPPSDDIFYSIYNTIEEERNVLTDGTVEFEEDEIDLHKSFDLNLSLSRLSSVLLRIGVKLFPIDVRDADQLLCLLRVVRALCRCCLRVTDTETTQNVLLWKSFLGKLMSDLQFDLQEHHIHENSEYVTPDQLLKEKCPMPNLEGLSRKEKKLKIARYECEKKLWESCVKAEKTLHQFNPEIEKINKELNLYVVGLVLQCRVCNKVTDNDEELGELWNDWIKRLRLYLMPVTKRLSEWRNEEINDWLNFWKQIIQLTYDNYNPSNKDISDVFIDFAEHVFIDAHPESKIKRISCAVFVKACCLSMGIINNSIDRPVVTDVFWSILIDLLTAESVDGYSKGLPSNHPTFVSSQNHYDVTVPMALNILITEQYPGIVYLFRCLDDPVKALIKETLSKLRGNLRWSSYHKIKTAKERNSLVKATNKLPIPEDFFWDYFSHDMTMRKDEQKKFLKPVCSSFDEYFCR